MLRCFILLTLFASLSAGAQTIKTFTVHLPQATNGIAVPTTLFVKNVKLPTANSFTLVKLKGNKKSPVAFQITEGKENSLSFLTNDEGDNKTVKYQLVKVKAKKFSDVKATKNDGALILSANNKNLLSYHYKTMYPPAGIDTNYKRSGFIHPLWTPNGQVLTNIQPIDHYHHYGIWNPWTHTVFEKDTVDFWNLKSRQGTVRFTKFISQTSGPVFSQFQALHEHVVFKKDGTEKIALNEIQTVKVYNPGDQKDYYIFDFTSQLQCATDSPLLIVAYRYAGLGWRATDEWTKDNCEVLTSEGKTRTTTDGTKARWLRAQGKLGNDYGGLVMMSNPENYNHPEPLRIWDEKANGGRGDFFASFSTTKDKNWLLEPGKTYTLKYRFIVFNGKFDAAKAEAAWRYFANQPLVTVQ
ncbi:MAG: PmoA family protein [Bacteroidota bacterium]